MDYFFILVILQHWWALTFYFQSKPKALLAIRSFLFYPPPAVEDTMMLLTDKNDLRLKRKEASNPNPNTKPRLRAAEKTGYLCCSLIPSRGAGETPQSKVLWFHFEQKGWVPPANRVIHLARVSARMSPPVPRWRYANGNQLVPSCRAVGASQGCCHTQRSPTTCRAKVGPGTSAPRQGAVLNSVPPTGAGDGKSGSSAQVARSGWR